MVSGIIEWYGVVGIIGCDVLLVGMMGDGMVYDMVYFLFFNVYFWFRI